jgi:D-3-phosphoglycerate dehydrogenase
VESDSVKGPVFDLPLGCIGSCRGDPNNVDIAAAATSARRVTFASPTPV